MIQNMSNMKVRGLRNNNPANIRRGSTWKGLVPFLVDANNGQRYYDKQFCQFKSMEYGVRAFFALMKTYHYKYKLNTVSKVLHRFAPLSENNTYAYIANVCRWMSDMYELPFDDSRFHVAENEVFCWFTNPHEPSFACRCLAKAIFRQECGFDCDDELINKAIELL